MNNNDAISYVGNGIAVFLTAIQDNPTYQTICAILTLLSILITIGYTIYKWYKKAKEDGKISVDEYKELLDELNEIKESKIDPIINKEDDTDASDR